MKRTICEEKRYTVSARNEVVLSAGATNTPQLLILSGLGPASQLYSLGINPVLDLPAVGANLIDHTLVCPAFSVNSSATFDDISRNATLAAETFALWNTTGQGQFAAGLTNQIAWLRVPKNESVWNEVNGDPSAGGTAGNYEFLFTVRHALLIQTGYYINDLLQNGYIASADPLPETGHFVSVCIALVTPSSSEFTLTLRSLMSERRFIVGNLTLSSPDVFTQPLIDPAHLASKFDIGTIIYGIKSLLRFLSAPNFASISPQPFGRFAEALTTGGLSISPVISHSEEGDAALELYVRETAGTVFHPVGTAAMAKKGVKSGSNEGVVDNHLRVLGVDGLRVVDASVFVRVPIIFVV